METGVVTGDYGMVIAQAQRRAISWKLSAEDTMKTFVWSSGGLPLRGKTFHSGGALNGSRVLLQATMKWSLPKPSEGQSPGN